MTGDKLAQDVRDRFTAIETAAATEVTNRTSAVGAEASSRTAADNNLQGQINTHTTQISAKCEVYYGTYTANNAAQQDIYLGFAPKAVFILYDGNALGNYEVFGGMAFAGQPLLRNGYNCITLSSTGFTVYYTEGQVHLNRGTTNIFFYLVFK